MMKKCYYQILQVDRKATPGQVKSAYRKMALKYHPDKNPSQDAKKIFIQIQQAYDVLSDPNQRTFYDNNREKILFNKDQMSKQDLQQYSFGFNIYAYFTAKCYTNFTDQQGSFFSVYRDIFEKIKAQEVKAFKSREDLDEQMRKFEGFGVAQTNMEKVIAFYQNWENFTTYKTFTWSQQYDTRDAQNRWVKRRMQEENKKQRQKQKKNYIKTIKDLVSFVKKRDPRFQKYLIQLKQQQERKQKQKIKKAEQKKKQKQDMKKVKQQLQQQRFKQIQQYYKQQNALNNQNTNNHVQNEDDEEPEFFCAVCDKIFKSQNQLVNHQKSKMHKQNVKTIQKQVMLPEDLIQQAQTQQKILQNNEIPEITKKKRVRRKKNKNNLQQKEQESDEEEQKQIQKTKPVVQNKKSVQNNSKNQQKKKQTKKNQTTKNKKKQKSSDQQKEQKIQKNDNKKNNNKKAEKQSQSSDDEDILMSLANNRNNPKTVKPVIVQKSQDQDSDDENNNKKKKPKNKKKEQPKIQQKNSKKQVQQQEQQGEQQKKLGKAKLKKMKKAQQQKQTGMKCKTCGMNFPSKSKLFDHIKQSGHAATKIG